MPDDESDRVKPWTIKGIPPEARNAAIAAADRDKATLGEWITRAIRSQIQSDRAQPTALAVVGPTAPPKADLAEVERVVAMTASLAAAGAPPPKAVSRAAYGLLREALADMRGPTAGRQSPTKKASSPTEASQVPTEDADDPTAD